MNKIDLDNLTPAPWSESFRGHEVSVSQSGGAGVAWLHSSEPSLIQKFAEADAVFIALARNAFDVMMRRGWGVVKLSGGWCPALPTEDDLTGLRVQRWPDPLTALVEADLWYKQNVRFL